MSSTVISGKKILQLNPNAIKPNPQQPRRNFDAEAMAELTASIRQYGILQPLTVRKTEGGDYELVAGERRLRAALNAGLPKVPCIQVSLSEQDSGMLALMENLQRQDLNFIEEAEGLRALIRRYGLSQEEAARCLGRSQSAVANKLRLLRISPELLAEIQQNNLTERHARALLRLSDDAERREVIRKIIAEDLTVAGTERYIETLLKPQAPKKSKKPPRIVLKDVRIFLNTITKGLGMMQRSGVEASCDRSETEADYILTIRIPKAAAEGH